MKEACSHAVFFGGLFFIMESIFNLSDFSCCRGPHHALKLVIGRHLQLAGVWWQSAQ